MQQHLSPGLAADLGERATSVLHVLYVPQVDVEYQVRLDNVGTL